MAALPPGGIFRGPTVLDEIKVTFTYEEKVEVKRELPAARQAQARTASALKDVFGSVQVGKALDAPRVLVLVSIGFALSGFVLSGILTMMVPLLTAIGLGAAAVAVATLFGPAQVLSRFLNMGLGKMVSKKKDFIGMVLSQREGLTGRNGYRLVGVRPVDPKGKLTAGSHFLAIGAEPVAANDEGWLTSKVYSPHVGSDIALGYLKGGDQKIGQRMRAINLVGGTDTLVEIVSPHFLDPEGERLRG